MNEEKQIYRNTIRLDNPRAVQRLIARTVNMLNNDLINESKARCVGYLCNILLNSFESIDYEMRIKALEEKLQKEEEGAEEQDYSVGESL